MLVPRPSWARVWKGPWGRGSGTGRCPEPAWEYVALEPGLSCAAVPEIACQGEASEEDANADGLPAGLDGHASDPARCARCSAESLTHF